jgi:hypothetical protein
MNEEIKNIKFGNAYDHSIQNILYSHFLLNDIKVKIYIHVREEATGDWRKLRNDEPH